MPEDGQYVQVYYNLHKNCLSVQNRQRKVIAHVATAVLRDAEFYVSEAGRQRVLRDQCKNVHAKIRGIWCSENDAPKSRRVRYNPYLFETFVFADTEEPVHKADLVVIDDDQVFIAGEPEPSSLLQKRGVLETYTEDLE